MRRALMDRMMMAVRSAQKLLGDSPEVAQALEPAFNAGYFLCLGHGYDFEYYLGSFHDPALPVSGTFDTKDDFVAWVLTKLEAGRVPYCIVEIAGVRHRIAYSRARGDALLVRIPALADVRRPFMGEGQERLWEALDRAYAALSVSGGDVEGLHWAALALHFICEAGCASEYAEFVERLDDGPPPLCTFETMEEAERWLATHPSPPSGAPIRVVDEEYMVGYWPESERRAFLRLLAVTTVGEWVKPEEGGEGGGGFVH